MDEDGASTEGRRSDAYAGIVSAARPGPATEPPPESEPEPPSDTSGSFDEDSVQPWQKQLSSPSSSGLASLSSAGRSISEASLSGTSLERADSAAARMESLARLTGKMSGPAPTSRGLPAFLLGKHREEAERRGFPGLEGVNAVGNVRGGSPVMVDSPGMSSNHLMPLAALGEGQGLGFGVGLGGRGVPRLSALQRKALERIHNGDVVGGAALNRSHTTTGDEGRRAAGRLALGALRNRPLVALDPATSSTEPTASPPLIQVGGPESTGRMEQQAKEEEAVAQDARQQARSNLMRKLSNRGAARTPPLAPSPSPLQQAESMGPSPISSEVASSASSSSSRLDVVRPKPRPRSGSMGDLPSSHVPPSLFLQDLEAEPRYVRGYTGFNGDVEALVSPVSPPLPIKERQGMPRQKPSAVMDRLAGQQPLIPRTKRKSPSPVEEDDEQVYEARFTFDESPTDPDFSSPLLRSGSSSSVVASPRGFLVPPDNFLQHPPSSSPHSPAPTTASTRASGISAFTATSQFRGYRHSLERDRDSILDKMGLASDGGAWDLEKYNLTPRSLDDASNDHSESVESPVITFPAGETPNIAQAPTFAGSSPASAQSPTPFTPQLTSPSGASASTLSPTTFPQSPESVRSRPESPANLFRPQAARNLGLVMAADEEAEEEAEEENVPIILDSASGHSPNHSVGRARVINHHPRGPSFGRSGHGGGMPGSVISFPASVSSNSVAESDATARQSKVSGKSTPLKESATMGGFRFPPVTEESESPVSLSSTLPVN